MEHLTRLHSPPREREMEPKIIPDKCSICGHEIGYHYDDGNGNVICRFDSDCGCATPLYAIDALGDGRPASTPSGGADK